jgi:hypothetical protein
MSWLLSPGPVFYGVGASKTSIGYGLTGSGLCDATVRPDTESFIVVSTKHLEQCTPTLPDTPFQRRSPKANPNAFKKERGSEETVQGGMEP